jgi:hypothetical protein
MHLDGRMYIEQRAYHVAFYFLDFLEMDHVAFGGRATCLAATLDLCLGGRQPVNVT